MRPTRDQRERQLRELLRTEKGKDELTRLLFNIFVQDQRSARKIAAGRSTIKAIHNLERGLQGADIIYTDVWASMGQEEETALRREVFKPYQVNEKVVSLAKREALVLHCLPAHRGDEITDEILESPQSAVFQQAENRLHAQKGLLAHLL